MNSSPSFAGPLALVVIVVFIDAWVYLDAQARAGKRRPVVASIGNLMLETPTAWLIACLLLWVLFFPMYLVARSRP